MPLNLGIWRREAEGDRGRPRVTTASSSRAQVLAPDTEPSPLTTPPGPLKLRLFGE